MFHVKTCAILSVDVRICSQSSYLLSFIDTFAENRQLTFFDPTCLYRLADNHGMQ